MPVAAPGAAATGPSHSGQHAAAALDLTHVAFGGVAAPARRYRPRPPRRLPPARPPVPAAQPTGPEVDFVRWFLARTGVPPDAYRLSALLRRVPACLRALRAGSLADARAMLDATPSLLSVAADCFFIGVTAYYRDPPVFDALRRLVLPRLAARPALDVWSVGCSSGAEVYTVACLLADAGLLARTQLVGSDLRPGPLSQAAAGLVTPQHAQTIPPAWRTRYFSSQRGLLVAQQGLRSRTRWHCRDAFSAALPEPGSFDLVLCRNLAVYLEPAASGRLWMRLAAALRPGGCLMTGRAEKPTAPTLDRLAPSVYLKREARP